MAARKREGELNSRAKLNEKQVIEIRELCDNPVTSEQWSYTAIGREFGVSRWAVRSIAIRRTWRNIPEGGYTFSEDEGEEL